MKANVLSKSTFFSHFYVFSISVMRALQWRISAVFFLQKSEQHFHTVTYDYELIQTKHNIFHLNLK